MDRHPIPGSARSSRCERIHIPPAAASSRLLLRKAQLPRQPPNFLLAAGLRRRSLDQPGLAQLLDDFRVARERFAVLAKEVLFLEWGTRPLPARLARFKRITYVQRVEWQPILRRLYD